MSDVIFYRPCARCSGFVPFPRPEVGIIAEGDEKPTELVDWERMRDTTGVAFEHAPRQCPDEIAADAAAALGNHRYRVEITLYRDDEVVVQLASAERESVTFDKVSEQVSRDLNERWVRVLGMSSVFDADDMSKGGETDGGATPA
jgi:hypothetical protein